MASKAVAVRPNDERAINTLLQLIEAKNVDDMIRERFKQNLITVQGELERLHEEVARLKGLQDMVPELERLQNIERASRSRLEWGNRWEPGDRYSGVDEEDDVLTAWDEETARVRHSLRNNIPGATDTIVVRVVTTYVTAWQPATIPQVVDA